MCITISGRNSESALCSCMSILYIIYVIMIYILYTCGIMDMRKKGVKRSQQKFVVDGEAVQNVVDKYLGCIINECAEV